MSKENQNSNMSVGDLQGDGALVCVVTQRLFQLLLGENEYQQKIAEPVKRMMKEKIWEQELRDAQNHLMHQE